MMTCSTCRWGELRESGAVYCTVNLYWHKYNRPDQQCNCQDVAGSHVPRWEQKPGK